MEKDKFDPRDGKNQQSVRKNDKMSLMLRPTNNQFAFSEHQYS